MATQKQIEANRKNAKESTGPKTPDGKAITAQNATKHGLTAQKPLIPGEDPEQFAIFNNAMLDDLTPHGPLETVLANRIITLTWQLNRAPRLQAAAFNHMIDNVFDPPRDPEKRLGKAIVRDFVNYQTLEKLQTYEQRIESNIYKTIAQLEKIQIKRKETQNTQQAECTPAMNPALNAPQPTPQSTNYEPPTMNSCKNKPNSPTAPSTNYQLPTTNYELMQKQTQFEHPRHAVP